MTLDFSFLSEYYQYFIDGTLITIMISFFGVILGSFFGSIVCLIRISPIKLISFLASAFIEIIRGTPLLVQLLIVYNGFPMIGINLPTFGGIPGEYIAAIFALVVNSSAYIAEILRSGIQSVDKGQMEASRSLGLSYSKTMMFVILPQAIKNALPSIANEFIVLIKESSIVSFIGIGDLMYNADIVEGATYKAFEPLLIAAIIYFILTFSLSKLLSLFEKKLHANSAN